MAGTHRSHRLSRVLPFGLALVASGAMVAGSSALAWPSLKGYLTPPTVSSAMPELFVPASAGLTGLRGSIAPEPAARAFVAETLVQVADTSPMQQAELFEAPQRGFATQGMSAPTYFLGTSVETTTPDRQTSDSGSQDQAAALPNDGSEDEVTTPPQTRPLVASPRQPLARTPVLRTSADLDRTRGRLEGHWSVGKFR